MQTIYWKLSYEANRYVLKVWDFEKQCIRYEFTRKVLDLNAARSIVQYLDEDEDENTLVGLLQEKWDSF